ncbi:MAG: M23 family metallopeptidase [Bacteroidales bacterium]|nr:M23 family metallopeptidase [Bacteroidales bacterium]
MPKKKKLFHKLSHKYRLVFFNDQTYEEVWHLRLSVLNLMSLIGTLSLIGAGLVILLVIFTPLREFFPFRGDDKFRREAYDNLLRLDSLEQKIKQQDLYVQNVIAVLTGDQIEDSTGLPRQNPGIDYKNIAFRKSPQDTLLRRQIEEEERFNFTTNEVTGESGLSGIHFFTPAKGLVTAPFDTQKDHYGIDIVGAPNEIVKSVLDGTVLISAWTFDTGQVIEIQHENNLVSIYKHNARLLKKSGDLVRAGEAIAIMGNSGEYTSGPHLHFEIWHQGKALNPEDYISF